ncbi:Uma2 family endonuclease [Cohnella caldifontis]|uniref:Uma2 family endonuclease n=1 Tax=Cohnella caldifontis TaxID=3027471 RepID=UPI0023ECCF6A|nr:Uma2 family endonuclease [Cohnella sp. YIM B05605]
MSGEKSPKRPAKVKEQQGIYDIPERYEIIGGVRYDFLSSPIFVHQKILTNLHLAFHGACSLEGEIILAPMDVHFDEENIVQPDLIFVAASNLGIIRDGYVFGVPDLLVEILSDSTGSRDKTLKKSLYERAGVKEYWLVDPIYRTVDQFVLEDGRYRLAATLAEPDFLESPTIPCLSVDLVAIFPKDSRQ